MKLGEYGSNLKISELRYYRALFAGEFSYAQTLKAQLQDLARSIACQGLREMQMKLISDWESADRISSSDASDLARTVQDELATDGQPSHLDVRLQIFDGLGYERARLERVRPLPPASEAAAIFRSLFEESGLLEMTAAVGAIEQWYVPIAAKLEDQYLSMGYSKYQVATYTMHKRADISHSKSALSFVDRYAKEEDRQRIMNAITAGFRSVKLYDEARYLAAIDETVEFADYLAP